MMKLYGVSLSPFHERCVMVAELKGAMDQIEYGGVPGGNLGSAEHLAHNPFGKIPYLEKADGSILPEGQTVAEYLDAVLDGPAVTSDDPDIATQQSLVCRLVDHYVIEPVLAINRGAKGEAREKAIQDLRKGLDGFETFFAPGARAVGDTWSIADCALVPFVFHYRLAIGDTDFTAWPGLARWWDNVREETPVVDSFDRAQKSLEAIIAMRKAAAGKTSE